MSTDDSTHEPSAGHTPADPAPAEHYEIRVGGHLGSRWATRFDGMRLIAEDDGTTVIRGRIVDQAALHGVLRTLRDMGVTLLSLNPLPPYEAVAQPHDTHDQTHHHATGATS